MAENRSRVVGEQVLRALNFLDLAPETSHVPESAKSGKLAAVKLYVGQKGAAKATHKVSPKGRQSRSFVLEFSRDNDPLLPGDAIGRLATKLHVEEKVVLEASRIPGRTFYRRQKQKLLSATESDRVMRIARVGAEAERVFGDEEKAMRWLSKPNRMLGAKPLDLLASDAGSREVEAELQRIDFGDFA